jgi:hypothetical protein
VTDRELEQSNINLEHLLATFEGQSELRQSIDVNINNHQQSFQPSRAMFAA